MKMFDEHSKYNLERVKRFLRYLVKASSKVHETDFPHVEKPVSKKTLRLVDERLMNMTQQRRDELEKKIASYYARKKYHFFEEKLRELKKRYILMRKSKKYSRQQILSIRKKIKVCHDLLQKIKSKN